MFFADLVEAEHGLDALSRAGLKGCEAKLAGVALEHYAAGNADYFAGRDVGLEVWVSGANCVDSVSDREGYRVGVVQFVETLALFETNSDLLRQVFVLEFFAHRFGSVSSISRLSIKRVSPTFAATMAKALPRKSSLTGLKISGSTTAM